MSSIEIRRVDDGVVRLLVDGQDISNATMSATLHVGPEHALLTVEPAIYGTVGSRLFVSVGREVLHALVAGEVELPPETRTALIALGWTPPGTVRKVCDHRLDDPPCPTCGRGMEDNHAR